MCTRPTHAAAAAYPYTPSHDAQKLMRASLASSCLRGELCVWQFMEGVQGREVRRRGCVTEANLRLRLLRGGVLHRVCAEPALRGEAHVRPMGRLEYEELCRALAGEGHVEMAEWVMSSRAFLDGGFHKIESRRWAPVADNETDDGEEDSQEEEEESSTAVPELVSHLTLLARAACTVDWEVGLQKVQVLAQASDDPVAVAAWKGEGVYPVALAMACAQAGSASSLRWTQHFLGLGSGTCISRLVRAVEHDVLAGCTLPVAEWLSTQNGQHLVAGHHPVSWSRIAAAAKGGNWQVMEWLVHRGHNPPCGLDMALVSPINEAARHGNVAVLRFLTASGLKECSSSASDLAMYSTNDTVAVLRWLHEIHGAGVIPGRALAQAARVGNLPAVEWLVEQRGYAWTADVLRNAAKGSGDVAKSLQVLEWANRHGHLRAVGAATLASVESQLMPFLLAHAPELVWHEISASRACGRSLEVVKVIHSRQPELFASHWNLQCAARGGRVAVLEFLLDHLASSEPESDMSAPGSSALNDAYYAGQLHAVEFLHRRFPNMHSPEALRRAADSGAVCVLEWVWKHREELQISGQDAADHAASNGHLQATRFLVQRCGSALPTSDDVLTTLVCRHDCLHVLEYVLSAAASRGDGEAVAAAAATNIDDSTPWPTVRYLQRVTCLTE